jgi:glycosyltransferase involved in cell wall biosynthesis
MSGSPAKQRLRVLTLVDGIGTFGGGERVARQLTTHLNPARFETTFCVSRWQVPHNPLHDAALEELREADVTFLGLRRSSRLNLRPWGALIAYIRRREVDVLHTHMVGSNIWGALIDSLVKVPVFVAHEHTWSFQGQPHRKFIDRNLISRRADVFVAVSRADQRRMTEIERIPERKVRFIPNGIAPSPPPDPGHDVRSELGIEPDQPVVGIVAVARAQKALDVLLRAAAQIRTAFPDVKVLLVGGADNPEDSYVLGLHALARELKLDSTVSFLGPRSDVPDLLRAFDVAVLSSDFEGSPLSVLEYMEAGRPVVSTRVGGLPDIVEDGVTGLLVKPRDPGALAAAVSNLLRNPERAAAMGRAGQKRQRDEFSIEAMARRFEELYEELYSRKTAAHPPS